MSQIKHCQVGLVGMLAPPTWINPSSEEEKDDLFFLQLTTGVTRHSNGYWTFDDCNRRAKHSMVYKNDDIGDNTKYVRRLCDLHFEVMEIMTEPQKFGRVTDKTGKYYLGIRIKLRKNRL